MKAEDIEDLYSANMKRDVSLDDIFSAPYVLKKEEEKQWAEKLVRLGFEGDCTGKKIKKDELYSIIVALTAAENGKNFMETRDGEDVSRAARKERELAEKLDEISTVVIAGMQLKKWVEDRLGRRNGNGVYPEVGDPGEPPELEGLEENEWIIEEGGENGQLEVESDADAIAPAGKVGGSPKGNYTDGSTRGLIRQNETADVLADQGYDVTMLEDLPGGNGYGLSPKTNPDYLINNKVFDSYAPDAKTSVNTIVKEISQKTKDQASNIALNLDDYTGNIDDLIESITRKANPQGDLKRLQELIIIKNNEITTLQF